MLPGQLSQDDCARLFTRHPLIDKGGGGEMDWAVRVKMAWRHGSEDCVTGCLYSVTLDGSNRAGMGQLAGLKLTLIVFLLKNHLTV